MPCTHRQDNACRAELADLLSLGPNPRSRDDFEGPCPECGHGGFGLSAPTKTRSLRHIWKCNCGRCRCAAGTVRVAMLKHGADVGCLGDYDGPVRAIDEDMARRLERTARDITAVPAFTLTEVRIQIAEALLGRKAPEDFGGFVKFAVEAGVSRSRAYEAARKSCS